MYFLQIAVLLGIGYIGYKWLTWVPLPTLRKPMMNKEETVDQLLSRLKRKHALTSAPRPTTPVAPVRVATPVPPNDSKKLSETELAKINQCIDNLFRQWDDGKESSRQILTPEQ